MELTEKEIKRMAAKYVDLLNRQWPCHIYLKAVKRNFGAECARKVMEEASAIITNQ